QPPLVAARQRARSVETPRMETDIVEQAFGLVPQLLFRIHAAEHVDAERAVPAREGRRHDVVEHRKVGEYLGCLEDARDAELVDLVRGLSGKHMAVEDHRPARGRKTPDDDIQERRLARAIRADDGMRPSFLDLQVDVGKGTQTPEVLMHVGGVQNGVGLLVHEACSYSAGCGWDRGSAPFSFPPSQRDSCWLPSTRPLGRKTTMSTKSRPSVRCQPSPTNLESTVTSGCSTPSGRNDRK